jgi:hypothetical protein
MNQKIITLIALIVCTSFAQTYNRSDWGASWVDADKDCQKHTTGSANSGEFTSCYDVNKKDFLSPFFS